MLHAGIINKSTLNSISYINLHFGGKIIVLYKLLILSLDQQCNLVELNIVLT